MESDPKHQMAIEKRQREIAKLEASTEAFTQALKKVFKQSLKDEDTRSAIHQETQNGKKGLANNEEMKSIIKQVQSQGNFGGEAADDTGWEKRYWEVDTDDE
jgi:DNA anti-recombination protein RmuC